MAFGKNSGGSKTYAKLVAKPDGSQVGMYLSDGTEISWLDGQITEIEHRSFQYNGEDIFTYKFYFEDVDGQGEKETIVLEMNVSSMHTASFVNHVCGLQNPYNLRLEVWRKTEDGKTHLNHSLKQDGTRLGWAFKYDALPKVEKMSFGGKTLSDSSKRDLFLRTELAKAYTRLFGKPCPFDPQNPAQKKPQDTADTASIVADQIAKLAQKNFPSAADANKACTAFVAWLKKNALRLDAQQKSAFIAAANTTVKNIGFELDDVLLDRGEINFVPIAAVQQPPIDDDLPF